MQLVLIRHLATEGNHRRLYIGSTDQPILPPKPDSLVNTKAALPCAKLLFCSPLRRCLQTAELFYPALSPIILPQLAEIAFGDFEGKGYEQLKSNPAYREWIAAGGHIGAPNGESIESFVLRCREALYHMSDAMQKANADTAVCVTHGGVIMQMLSTLFPDRDFYSFQCENGGGYRLDLSINDNGNSLSAGSLKLL